MKLNVLSSVGVPEILPVEMSRFKPSGNVPENKLQEYGAIPPDAVKVTSYGAATVPSGRGELVVMPRSGRGLMVNENGPMSVCPGVLLSETWTVNVKVPSSVGMPEI